MNMRLAIGVTLLLMLVVIVGTRLIGGIDPPPFRFVPVMVSP